MPPTVIFVLLTLPGYLLVLWAYRMQKLHAAIALIIGCGLLLKLGPALDPWVHDWDERYHALVGRNLTHHFLLPTLYDHPVLPYDYKNWTANHIWVHKQPVALWLIALSLKLFGYCALAVRIPSLLFCAVSTWVIYDIGRRWYRPAAGLWAAFLFSVNGLILDLATGNNNTDHVDVLFLCFVLLSIRMTMLAHERANRWLHVWAGGLMGVAILTKWLPALIVVPVWLLLAGNGFRKSKGRTAQALLLFLAGAACVAIP